MRRGELVTVVWPFSDRTGAKSRPAVVIQADFLNARIDDTILVQITSTSRGLSTEVVLDPAVEVNSGLRMLSVALCSNVLTLDKSLVNRRLGSLSSTAMHQIEAGVKIALALP